MRLQNLRVKDSHMISRKYSGGWLGIFWKVAQSLQKCRPRWLAEEENFGLWNG